ncbi:MAG: sialidase family protein [Candidatus Thorarchaeota archaeon]
MKKRYLTILLIIFLQQSIILPVTNYDFDFQTPTPGIPSSLDNPYDFTFNVLLSVDDSKWAHHVEPTMAIGDNNTIFVGWKNAIEHDGGGRGVSFTYSKDSLNWSYPDDMAPAWSTGSGQSDPWMVYFNHTLYYSYLEFSTGTQDPGRISFAQTSDLGLHWKQVRASYGTGDYADKETFAIGHDGVIYLVYSDVHSSGSTSNAWVRLTRSFDGGNTFVDNVTISDTKGIDISANVLPGRSGNVYCVWTHYSWEEGEVSPNPELSTLVYDNSTDSGNTFGRDRDFIPEYNATWSMRNPENNRSAKHTIAIIKQEPITERLYVTWADVSTNVKVPESNWDVFFRYSDDLGITWSDIVRVNSQLGANQWNPDMEFDSKGNVHFVYYDESSPQGRHVRHRIFYPDLNEFSSEAQVTTEASSPDFTRPGEYMSIRIDSDDIPHIVWTDARSNALDIYYTSPNLSGPESKSPSFASLPLYLAFLLIVTVVLRIRRSKRKNVKRRLLHK